MNTINHYGSNSTIKKQFIAKFSEVQTKFREKMNYGACLKCMKGSIATYQVLEEIVIGDRAREAMYSVEFNHAVMT